MKISSNSLNKIQGRRGAGRFFPYHRPSTTNQYGTMKSESDNMFIENAQKNKMKNKPGKGTVGGSSSRRYVDMDYSYERMTLSDRLLDMNPAPPPYADTLIRWDLDLQPQVPVPQFTYDAYEDPDNDKPEDEPKDEDENEEEQPPKEMTKEEWEAAFKNNDKGTYDLYLYTNYYLYTDGKYHVMDEGTYDFFSKYMHFEDNYGYDNPWFNKDTQFKLVEFKNEEEGIVYMQFHFIKDGAEYYFSMPVDTYDPRNNEGEVPTTEPEPEDQDSNENGKDTESDNWKRQNVDENGYYKIPTTKPSEGSGESVPEDLKVWDTQNDITVTASTSSSKSSTKSLTSTKSSSGGYDPSNFYDMNSSQTKWLIDYLTYVTGIPNAADYYGLNTPNRHWAFVNYEGPAPDYKVYTRIQGFWENGSPPTGGIFKSISWDLGSTKFSNPNPPFATENLKGEIISNFQFTKEQKFDKNYLVSVDSKSGIEKFRLPENSFAFSGPVGQYQHRLTDVEWQFLQDFMMYSNSYYQVYNGKMTTIPKDTILQPQSRDVLFNVVTYTKPNRLVLSSYSQYGQNNTFMITIPL